MKISLTDSKLYWLLLVLACINFQARGSVIFILLALFVIIKLRFHLSLDWCGVATFFLMLSIFFASAVYYDGMDCIKSVNYFFPYVIGFEGYRRADNRSRFIGMSMFSIFLGTGLYLILELYYNAGKVFASNRMLLNIWTGEYISVTLVGLISSVVIGYACYGVFFSRNFKLAVLSASIFFVAIILNFRTATRTPFVIVTILLAAIALISFQGQGFRRNIKLLMVLSAAFLVGIIAFQFNAAGIRTLILSSNLYARFQGTDSISRISISLGHFSHMLEHPFGGKQIAPLVGMTAHNMLQECYDLYGGLAALCELILSISMARNIIALGKTRAKSKYDWLLLCMYIPVLIQCYLEPVHEGYTILLWSLLMIHGMANAYLRDAKSVEIVGVRHEENS